MSPDYPPESPEIHAAPRGQLTLLDSTSIIVGIVIGSSIYESTPLIARQAPSVGWLLAAWVLGAVFTLVGAVCYAELACRFPHEGGDYVYLNQAFGRSMGFLFAWMQFWIVRPGSLGAAAYVFARYANKLCPLAEDHISLMIYAAGAVVVLSGVNLLGVRTGKWTQNLLTLVKFLGLVAIVIVGMSFTSTAELAAKPGGTPSFNLGFAMILIFYAYSGWNEMAYIGAEVVRPQRNILRALLLGTVSVSVLYIALTMAFVHALGLHGVRESDAVAADLLALSLGPTGATAISLLICATALAAINGMIFTGARIFYALGAEHRSFGWLGEWSPRHDTPARSIVLQAVVTVALIVGFGAADRGFEKMIALMGPTFWGFLLLVGVALIVLRRRSAPAETTFRVPFYPLLPIVFCLSSAFMFVKSLQYAAEVTAPGLAISAAVLLTGIAATRLKPAFAS